MSNGLAGATGTGDPGTTDVVVVGGGVIGLGVAWRAATRHALAVTVVDPAPGSGASRAAAGLLAPVSEVHYGDEPLVALATDSARRWPAFAAELEEAAGTGIGYRTEGTLEVGFDDDDLRALEDLCRYRRTLGLRVQRLRGRECRAIEGGLSPLVRGGVLVEGDHQVDNRRLLAALQVACCRAGVGFVAERAVTFTAPSSVTLANSARLTAGRVVLAAGCWSAHLDGLPAPAVPPVRPVKGQILRLRFDPAEALLGHNLRGLVAGRSVYLVPREEGEMVVGATVEDRGWDTSVTAGGVRALLDDATSLVPGVAELELVETLAGLRPGTPDNGPVLGAAPGCEGLVMATGHYRNGILLTPVTADAVAAVVAGSAPPTVAEPFGVERFGR